MEYINSELKQLIYVRAYNSVFRDMIAAGIDPDALDFEVTKDDVRYLRNLSQKAEEYYKNTDPISVLTVIISGRELTREQEEWLDQHETVWHLINEGYSEWDALDCDFVPDHELSEFLEDAYDDTMASAEFGIRE